MKDWNKTIKDRELVDIAPVSVMERHIVLFRLSDGIYALEDTCSHEFARLSEGEVWDENVYCPKHGSAFDIKSGAVIGLPATKPVTSYLTKTQNGYIYIKEKE